MINIIRKRRLLRFSIVGALLISVLAGCSALAKPDGNVSAGATEPAIQQTQAPESSAAPSADSGGNEGLSIGIPSNVKPGGSFGVHFQAMATGSSGLDWWKSSYVQFTGWITRGFKFTGNSDGKCVIQVDVTTDSGELDITVMDSEGKELYTYKNIATSSFDVDLGKGGDYQIRVDGRKHDGDFSIKQKS